jgi:uncharacterized protein (DUF4415 family)
MVPELPGRTLPGTNIALIPGQWGCPRIFTPEISPPAGSRETATLRRGRGKQVAPTKELVSLRLNREVLAKFRALGPGWQTRIDEVLSEAAKGR